MNCGRFPMTVRTRHARIRLGPPVPTLGRSTVEPSPHERANRSGDGLARSTGLAASRARAPLGRRRTDASTAAIGDLAHRYEAMKASSAARTSSSVHGASSTSHPRSSLRARVIESRIPSDSGGVRSRPSAAQKNVHVGPSSTRPCGVTSSASS